MTTRCRTCGDTHADDACDGAQRLSHPELDTLTLAHLDCDAFYASIEKRDNPELTAKPVIVGGGKRGVVSTCCYVARAFGVRSAMPMFKALRLCPQAVVIKPDMAKYAAIGLEIRRRMQALTPLVEPLSLDEAFMDLSGMAALHGAPPAAVLIRLQNEIERELRLTVSIGLSYNKFLAKLASDLDKPRGFAVIGKVDALDVLAPLPVERLPGVGKVGAQSLHAIGAHRIGDLRRIGLSALRARLGDWGERLFQLAQAHDDRRVDPDGERKSISAETTFEDDIADVESLEDVLWALSEKVAARARASNLAGKTVTLKLRTARFQAVTRQKKLDDPTLLAARLFETGRGLLTGVADGRAAFRLIGIGLSDFVDAATADRGDMFDTATPKRAAAEAAIAKARDKFGKNAVVSGRTLKSEDED